MNTLQKQIPNTELETVTLIVQDSLVKFAKFVRSEKWWGRENEAVSLYTLGFLTPHCQEGSILSYPTQICIEGAVPQVHANGKKLVRKDLIIWKTAAATCWTTPVTADRYPLCVMEWKVVRSSSRRGFNENGLFKNDLLWLESFASKTDPFIGFAVTLDISSKPKLACARVSREEIIQSWLVI